MPEPLDMAKRPKTCTLCCCILLTMAALLLAAGTALALLFGLVLQDDQTVTNSTNNSQASSTSQLCQNSQTNAKCKPFRLHRGEPRFSIPDEKRVAALGHWLGIKPLLYNMSLDLNYNGKAKKVAFTGTVDIRLSVVKNTSKIALNLDQSAANLNQIFVTDSCGVMICVKKVTANNQSQIISIELKSKLVAGKEYYLKLTFNGIQVRDGGIYKSVSGPDVWVLGTLFQMRYARRVFPCMDHPALKAKFKLCIKHRVNVTAYSNMPWERIDTKSGQTVTCFEETPLMPTYVFTFTLAKGFAATSKATKKNEIVSLNPHARDSEKFNWILDEAAWATNQMANITGTNLAMERLAFLHVDDSPFWGIENYGLVTLDAGWTRYPEYENGHQTLVHEVIHQWLGNYFTISHWDEICLQEGLTAYMEWRLSSQLESVPTTFKMKVESNRFNTLRNARYSHVIIRPFNKTQQIADDCFQKPPLVFNMLEQAFGPGLIDRFLSHMASAYPFGYAGLKEWADGFSKAAESEHAGEMLTNWFTKQGFVFLSALPDAKGVLVKSQLVAEDRHLSDEQLGLNVKLLDSSGTKSSQFVNRPQTNFPRTQGWFVLDPEGQTLSRAAYSGHNYRLLLECFENKLNSSGSCSLSKEQAHAVFLDFCWAMKLDLLPIEETQFDAESWNSVFQALSRLTSMSRGSRKLNLGATCACCFKSEEEIQSEADLPPWSQSCKRTWVKSCQPLKIMELLGKNYNLNATTTETPPTR